MKKTKIIDCPVCGSLIPVEVNVANQKYKTLVECPDCQSHINATVEVEENEDE